MNKYNTKFGQLLALIGRPQFDRIVKATNSDKSCKGFSTWQQFVTMAYAQLANPNGLRSLENSLNANHGCLYHLGIHKPVCRSTISYANSNRSPQAFEKLFYSVLATLDRSGRKKFRKDFYAVDATEISLNMHDFPWAEFRSTKGGVKINLKYDINSSAPDFLFITKVAVLTNDFNVSAKYAARLYRARWNIEIFFKAIKQNLRIKKFYGESENAVKTQIWIALIVYLLFLKLRQLSRNEGKNFTHFVSEISVCLFERSDLFEFFSGPPPKAKVDEKYQSLQLELWSENYLGH